FYIDFWTLWGFAAQLLFFLSFVVQWYKSEKKKESYLPSEFWYLRLIGALMLIIYVFQRRDIVFFVSLLLQMVIYGRNIFIMRKNRNAKNEVFLKGGLFERPKQ
ncbi:MAG: lipid-A-disaccharide synthase N-terminal domain-containing protein, partial [Deltaproteobacteria bacterium]|nr:lipid-A-disaccharide synthase N-terminal domain-containing protein [Deltaproteobacteria bacterium]